MTPPAADNPRGKLPFALDYNELQFEFMRSSGPGGQNVNKVSTACRLRLNLSTATSIPKHVTHRLRKLFPTRINASDELTIIANRFRTQLANRKDAINRLEDMLTQAAIKPKTRRATRPTLASKKRRLDSKKRRSQTKQNRRGPSMPDE